MTSLSSVHESKGPQMPSETSHFSAGPLIGTLATSLVAWLIMGALAYGDGTIITIDTTAAFTKILFLILLSSLFFAALETSYAWPNRVAAIYTAATMGFGATASYSILSTGLGNGFHRAFWSLGGIFGGLLFEALTGVFTTCVYKLEASVNNARNVVSVPIGLHERQE